MHHRHICQILKIRPNSSYRQKRNSGKLSMSEAKTGHSNMTLWKSKKRKFETSHLMKSNGITYLMQYKYEAELN